MCQNKTDETCCKDLWGANRQLKRLLKKKTRVPFNLLGISSRKTHTYKRQKWVDLLGDGEEQKQEVGMQAPQESRCHGCGSLMCSSDACWNANLVARLLHWLNVVPTPPSYLHHSILVLHQQLIHSNLCTTYLRPQTQMQLYSTEPKSSWQNEEIDRLK